MTEDFSHQEIPENEKAPLRRLEQIATTDYLAFHRKKLLRRALREGIAADEAGLDELIRKSSEA